MKEIAVARIIDATPARVWEVLTDLEHAAQTLCGVLSVQVLTDGPSALGTRWRETRKMFGRETSEELRVTDNDPVRRTQVRAESGGAAYVTEFVLTPLEGGTRTELQMRFGADLLSPSVVQRVAMKAFAGLATRATTKQLEQDLADIAAAAER
jgi:carbon monoxide dehydrogenase subunit G